MGNTDLSVVSTSISAKKGECIIICITLDVFAQNEYS